MQNDIKYTINGHHLENYGIHVSGSKGLIDGLKAKKAISYDWPEYHGQALDLSAPKYEPRAITLTCFMDAKNKSDFIDKFNAFLKVIQSPDLKRLEVEVIPGKALAFEVYHPQAIQVDKKWSDQRMVATFTLNFIEPEPVKKVLLFEVKPQENKTVKIALSTSKLVNIYWGDNSRALDLYGDLNLSHEYDRSGTYYIIISGVVNEITSFQTTAQLLWTSS